MRYIKIFEDFSRKHQERFDESIYLNYVDKYKPIDPINYVNRVSKEDFFKALEGKQYTTKVYNFDTSYRYRLADKKETFIDKNKTLGEAYFETDEFGNSVESYWLYKNTKY
jgi:hypothetical protein